MIYFAYRCFDRAKEANIDTVFADIDFSDFSSFIFKANYVLIVKEVAIDQEEPDGIETDGI